MYTYKLRFAPSPTGYMHLANARVAILNYTKAMQLKHTHAHSDSASEVKFVLRIDDTDTVRSKQIYTEQILKDLEWLGIQYDEIHYQSKRYDIYQEVIAKLKEAGFLYAAYETEEELKKLREEQLKEGNTPRYEQKEPKNDSDSSNPAVYSNSSHSINPCWRFKIGKHAVQWQDEIMGEQKFESKGLYDPIVVRGNGTITYMLASIIDDYMMNVTHIMRGRDHLTNTAIQLHMLDALNKIFNTNKQIQFAHFSLLYSIEGKKLSKRAESANIKDFRKEGLLNVTLIRFLLNLGLAESLKYGSIQDIITSINMSTYNRADIKCDTDQLYTDNQKYLTDMNTDEALAWVEKSGYNEWKCVKNDSQEQHVCNMDKLINISNIERLWTVIHSEVQIIEDLCKWLEIVYGDVNLKTTQDTVAVSIEEQKILQNFMSKHAHLIAAHEVKHTAINEVEQTINAWDTILHTLKTEYVNKDLSLKMCIMAFRHALTGTEHGPKMHQLFDVMSVEKIKARLSLYL